MKILKNILISSIFISLSSEAKPYAGLGGGWCFGKAESELYINNGAFDTEFKSKGSGFIGNIFLGNENLIDENSFWLQQLTIAFESTKPKNKATLNIGNNSVEGVLYTTRQYAASAKLGYGIKFIKDWSISINAGLAQTSFTLGAKFNDQKSYYVGNIWGLASGVNLYKLFDQYKLGLEYEYTLYQRMTKRINNDSEIKIKKPQYHALILSFSRYF